MRKKVVPGGSESGVSATFNLQNMWSSVIGLSLSKSLPCVL